MTITPPKRTHDDHGQRIGEHRPGGIVPELLTSREAAGYAASANGSMAWSRSASPAPVKIGCGPRLRSFRRSDLLQWIDAGCSPRMGGQG